MKAKQKLKIRVFKVFLCLFVFSTLTSWFSLYPNPEPVSAARASEMEAEESLPPIDYAAMGQLQMLALAATLQGQADEFTWQSQHARWREFGNTPDRRDAFLERITNPDPSLNPKGYFDKQYQVTLTDYYQILMVTYFRGGKVSEDDVSREKKFLIPGDVIMPFRRRETGQLDWRYVVLINRGEIEACLNNFLLIKRVTERPGPPPRREPPPPPPQDEPPPTTTVPPAPVYPTCPYEVTEIGYNVVNKDGKERTKNPVLRFGKAFVTVTKGKVGQSVAAGGLSLLLTNTINRPWYAGGSLLATWTIYSVFQAIHPDQNWARIMYSNGMVIIVRRGAGPEFRDLGDGWKTAVEFRKDGKVIAEVLSPEGKKIRGCGDRDRAERNNTFVMVSAIEREKVVTRTLPPKVKCENTFQEWFEACPVGSTGEGILWRRDYVNCAWGQAYIKKQASCRTTHPGPKPTPSAKPSPSIKPSPTPTATPKPTPTATPTPKPTPCLESFKTENRACPPGQTGFTQWRMDYRDCKWGSWYQTGGTCMTPTPTPTPPCTNCCTGCPPPPKILEKPPAQPAPPGKPPGRP